MIMASNVGKLAEKSMKMVHNGTFCILRTCYQETNRSSSGQSSSQSKDAAYGAPEFFQYNDHSFYDIHAEMEKYRLPRPSSKTDSADKK